MPFFYKSRPCIHRAGRYRQLEFLLSGIDSNNSTQGTLSVITILFQEFYTSEKYKELRAMFQRGMDINRDKMYDHPSPLKQLDQYVTSAPLEASTFDEFQQQMLDVTKRTPKNRFDLPSEKYITIGMAGLLSLIISFSI